MTKRALYIGRFNPFHKGHLSAIEYILNDNSISSLIIGIGSAQEAFTLKNPFTSSERFEMILSIHKKLMLSFSKEIFIIPLIDINNNNQWMAYITSLLPKFDVIFTNNPLVKLLCKASKKIDQLSIPLTNRSSWSSTTIREKMINNQDWSSDVPVEVYDYLLSFEAPNRLRSLSLNDKP